MDQANAKPFHIYDPGFYDIIGPNPSLTVIASSPSDPLFHEAVVWYVLWNGAQNTTNQLGIHPLMKYFSFKMLVQQRLVLD